MEKKYTLVYYHDLNMHVVRLNGRKRCTYTNRSRAENDRRQLEEKYPHLDFYIAEEKTLRL